MTGLIVLAVELPAIAAASLLLYRLLTGHWRRLP